MKIGVGGVEVGKMYGWWLRKSVIRQSTSERSGMMLLPSIVRSEVQCDRALA